MQTSTITRWARRPIRAAAAGAGLLALAGGALTFANAHEALDFWRQQFGGYTGRTQVQEQESEAPSARGRLGITIRPKNKIAAPAGGGGGGRYCVRTCDGYYFPVQASSDQTATALCRSLCPDAETEVYRGGRGENVMERGVSVTGKPYSALKVAFGYRSEVNPTCTCRKSTTSAHLHYTRDPTLKRGDIVVTAKGIRVFAGNSKDQHDEREFVDYRKSGLPRATITYLSAVGPLPGQRAN